MQYGISTFNNNYLTVMPVEKTIIIEHIEETEKDTWEASGWIFNAHSFRVAVVENPASRKAPVTRSSGTCGAVTSAQQRTAAPAVNAKPDFKTGNQVQELKVLILCSNPWTTYTFALV